MPNECRSEDLRGSDFSIRHFDTGEQKRRLNIGTHGQKERHASWATNENRTRYMEGGGEVRLIFSLNDLPCSKSNTQYLEKVIIETKKDCRFLDTTIIIFMGVI